MGRRGSFKLNLFMFLIVIMCFIIRIYSVDGESMEPSFRANSFVVVNCLHKKINDLKSFDVVAFKKFSRCHVKRVIGMPGDTVSIKGSDVYVNGALLNETYIKEKQKAIGNIEMKVPAHKLYVMGDNRNNSKDSRYIDFGLIDESELLGEVVDNLN